MIFVTLFSGWLSDQISRRRIFVFNLILIMLASPFLLNIFESSSFFYVAFAQVAIAIMAALYIGPEPALQAEFFPTKIRSTALSVSYNIATSVFGGTAPYIIESLVQNTGKITVSVYYILASSLTGLIALYFYKDRS
jgi:MHS family proline/betaine transporter-like MFS transporter